MPLPAGTELGTHKLLALTGVGGMGEVYKAHDTKLGRDVAIKVSRSRKFWLKSVFTLAVVLGVSAALRQNVLGAPHTSSPIEQGDFTLYFLQHPIGAEHYALDRTADGALYLHSTFEYTDRGVKVALTATLEMQSDYTPRRFLIEGKSYRYFNVDAAVEVNGAMATVREAKSEHQIPVPAEFFTVNGYAPVAVQMMMLRYWYRHGRPAHFLALPAGSTAQEVNIIRTGQETVRPSSAAVTVDRLNVNNVVWGHESAWMTEDQKLIALTSFTGGLGFEAVQHGFEPSFAQFVRSSVADRMRDLAAISASVPPVVEGNYAIVGAMLIDATGGAPILDSAVIVREGRIAAVGSRAQVTIPRGTRVIDGQGLTLLPGLWEMHAHYSQIEWGPAYLAEGVTTARDCGNEFDFITAVRDAIRDKAVLGPRLLLAGLIDGAGPGAFGAISAITPEEGRAAVQRYKNAGFAQIKIYDLIQPDVLRAITSEAHRLSMTVTGHIPNGMSAFDGVQAGMDQINHIYFVMDVMGPAGREFDTASPEAQKAIRFFKEHKTVVDPTLSWNELLSRPTDLDIASFEPGFNRVPDQLASLLKTASGNTDVEQWREDTEQSGKVVKALYDAGVPIVPGTDKGVPGFSLHRELELYLQAGLTPMQVIQTATIVPARVMGLDRDSGTIEPGKRADLILVRGNPLNDFSALRIVIRVVTAGRMYDPAPLWGSVGFRP